MISFLPFVSLLTLIYPAVVALPYDPEQEPWNLNTNETATDPLDYSGEWENHKYQASPTNWRFPVYTIFLDRFANGEPRYAKIACANVSEVQLTWLTFAVTMMRTARPTNTISYRISSAMEETSKGS